MNRRSFFGSSAALVAAPLAALVPLSAAARPTMSFGTTGLASIVDGQQLHAAAFARGQFETLQSANIKYQQQVAAFGAYVDREKSALTGESYAR